MRRQTIRALALQIGAGFVLLGLVGVQPATGAAPVSPAQPTTPSAPLLSIALAGNPTSGATVLAIGDSVTYTITVRNVGSVTTRGLVISQTVPWGVELAEAESDGVVRDGKISWVRDIAAGSEVNLHSTMNVTKTADQAQRISIVACAAASRSASPLVCASHTDALPAGAALDAEAQRVQQNGSGRTQWIWWTGGALIVLSVAAGLVVRRRVHSP